MGVINWVAFGGILIDLVIISIIISNAFWGYRRGLTGVMFKILTFIISIIIMFILYKPVSNAIIKNTELDEWITEKISQNIEGTTLKDGDLLEYDEENSTISKGMVDILNSFITDALKETTNNVVYYTASNIAYGMIRIGTMLILFMLSRFFLVFIRFAAEIIANLPIIKTFNKSGGLIYGVIKGFLIIYVVLAVFSIASPLIQDWGIIDAVQDSTLGSKMYNDNVIIKIVLKK
ncbi:MAG: CvpA family protein [Clostridia bacterium]|nr:CvpA family protein [Clostridia bacterium]